MGRRKNGVKGGKVRMHIGHRSMHKGRGSIHVEIEDVANHNHIMDIEFSLAAFGELIGGNGFIEGDAEFLDAFDTFGKKTELMTAHMPKSLLESLEYGERKDGTGRRIITEWLMSEGYLRDGWMMHGDGLSTQQPNPHYHAISLFRYVD